MDARDKPGHDGVFVLSAFQLRPYRAEDEDAAIALWLETWLLAYPDIDFAARVPWWRERWRSDLVPNADIIVAEAEAAMVGFVTIDRFRLSRSAGRRVRPLGFAPRHDAGR